MRRPRSIVSEVEKIVDRETPGKLPTPHGTPLIITVRHSTPWREIWDTILNKHRRRSFLSLTLMVSQAFFYNAIFFTYALLADPVLQRACAASWASFCCPLHWATLPVLS